MNQPKRVGHKGAHLVVPGNTLESFDAALALGVEMIEFDVLAERPSGELVLAHDYKELRQRQPITLAAALTHLSDARYRAVELDIDLKLPGYEWAVIEQVRHHQLAGRTLISTQYRKSLATIRLLDPTLKLGWSVPRVSRDYAALPIIGQITKPMLAVANLVLPHRTAKMIATGRCDAVMANWRLVTPQLVRAVKAVGGDLYVWTVDDPAQIANFTKLGVTGIITNDPRLFGNGSISA